MKRAIITITILMLAIFSHSATNTITSASTNLVLAGVFPSAVAGSTSTNRVETEGSLVQENGRLKQRTIDGWVQCPASRKFLIIQYISGAGTAVVRDNRGELIRLDDTVRVFVLSDSDALSSPIYINAVGGDVTISYTQRQ